MLTRRRWFWATACLALSLIGLAALWAFLPQSPYRINEWSRARIKKGMTLTEVEAIVGVPPGLYDVQLLEVAGFLPAESVSSEAWAGPDGTLVVFFDKDGGVVEARFHGESMSMWRRILSTLR